MSEAVYAIIDHRQDGAPRIVGQFADPASALQAADLLRWSGAATAEVVLVTPIRDQEPGA